MISPNLIDVLYRMGHGDELVLADAFFPGDTCNPRVIRADGIKIPALLDAILSLINLDSYVPNPVVMMDAVKGDTLNMEFINSCQDIINKHWPKTPEIEKIERFSFYEKAKNAFAVVMTGETSKYGNIIIKKGVIPLKKAVSK